MNKYSDKLKNQLTVKLGDGSEKYIDEFDNLRKFNRKEVKGVDINSFKSLDELKNFLNGVGKSKTETVKQIKNEGSEVVFDNEHVTVYHIKSEEASCILGSGTKWCTINIYNDNRFFYITEEKDGNLYYILVKNKVDDEGRQEKWAVLVTIEGEIEIFDNDYFYELEHEVMVFDDYKIPMNIFKKKELISTIPDEGLYIGEINGKGIVVSNWKGDSSNYKEPWVTWYDSQSWVDEYCNKTNLGGFSDWVVPTKDELNLIYENKSKFTGKDKFTADGYWSSSESSSTNAWYQNFNYGFQNYFNKTNSYRVRGVRRI